MEHGEAIIVIPEEDESWANDINWVDILTVPEFIVLEPLTDEEIAAMGGRRLAVQF